MPDRTNLHYNGPSYPNELQLKLVLRHVTYRPGWEFTVENGKLLIRATVINSIKQDENCPISLGVALPSYTPPEFDWVRWLFQQIMRVERHEAEEFFQINGRPPYDPHKLEGNSNAR